MDLREVKGTPDSVTTERATAVDWAGKLVAMAVLIALGLAAIFALGVGCYALFLTVA